MKTFYSQLVTFAAILGDVPNTCYSRHFTKNVLLKVRKNISLHSGPESKNS